MGEKKLNIGIVGYGYWGANILRNITEHPQTGQVTVCDINSKRIASAKSIFFPIKTTESSDAILHDPEIDAVIIATQTPTHYRLAKEALLNKKHVLVEK